MSFGQSRSPFAVQALLDATDYRGNQPPLRLPSGNGYQYNAKVPVSEFLPAYGVSKSDSKRGKSEYTSGGRVAALSALKNLSEKSCLHVYDRRAYNEGRRAEVTIEAVAPLIKLEQANGELVITPSPVLVDQVETFFVWKPTNLYTEILDGKDRTKALFIEYLLYLVGGPFHSPRWARCIPPPAAALSGSITLDMPVVKERGYRS